MTDRFRELEKPFAGERLDIVLMATVSGFETLARPSRHDLRQFSELFCPLFERADAPTRRMAAAALSRLAQIPPDVAALICDQPIDVCAPFLSHSPTLPDHDIARIVARHGAAHARALARRPDLSSRTAAMLAASGDAAVMRSLGLRGFLKEAGGEDSAQEQTRVENEERLRQELRTLVGSRRNRTRRAARKQTKLPPDAEARLVRFARSGEAGYFATALADALQVPFPQAEKIMLDISGHRLAETMTALGLSRDHARQALERFFPHLAARSGDTTRAEDLLEACDAAPDGPALSPQFVDTGKEPAPQARLRQSIEGRRSAAANGSSDETRAADSARSTPSRPVRRA